MKEVTIKSHPVNMNYDINGVEYTYAVTAYDMGMVSFSLDYDSEDSGNLIDEIEKLSSGSKLKFSIFYSSFPDFLFFSYVLSAYNFGLSPTNFVML